MNSIIYKLIDNSLFRFICVGVVNTVIGLGLTLVLFNLIKIGYWPATFIANTCASVVSYILNKKFTFKSSVNKSKSIPRFIIVIVCCYFISYYAADVISGILVPWLGGSVSSQFIGNVSIFLGMCFYTIINYFGQKFFAFRAI